MDRPPRRRGRWTVLCAMLVVALGPATGFLHGQQAPDTNTTLGNAAGSSDPGFLFSRPGFSLGLRGGMFVHQAGGELFDFAQRELTLDDSDFRGLAFGAEAGVWLGNRFELGIGVDLSRFTRGSEYRDWVEDDGTEEGLPIRQSTRLRTGPAATLGLRGYAFPRGEQLGRFVWIPRDWNVFAGGGLGVTAYLFEQWGDFVETDTGVIRTLEPESDGYAGLAFVEAGTEVGLTPRATLVLEARHQWADADMVEDFSRFEPVDLSGTRMTAGVRYRF